MANDLAAVTEQTLAMGHMALREQAIMPFVVNRDLETQAQEKGDTINMTFAGSRDAYDVVPSANQPSTDDLVSTKVPLVLNQHKGSDFVLSDTDRAKMNLGHVPQVVSEAIKPIANTLDKFILGKYKEIYTVAGAAANTPFQSDLEEAKEVRVALNKNLADKDDRRLVLDPDAEGNASLLANFLDADKRGDTEGIREASIGFKYGFDWFLNQNVLTHESTPLTAGAATINGVNAVDATSVSIAKATNTSDLVKGDILEWAGDSQTYVVTADTTLAVGNTSVPISPPIKIATTGGEAVTLTASHVVNLGLHRDCIAFATRPLIDTTPPELQLAISTLTDPVTGITMRLEVIRQNKRTRWEFDVLYGGAVARPELGVRLMG